jgi:hypothetical protein
MLFVAATLKYFSNIYMVRRGEYMFSSCLLKLRTYHTTGLGQFARPSGRRRWSVGAYTVYMINSASQRASIVLPVAAALEVILHGK